MAENLAKTSKLVNLTKFARVQELSLRAFLDTNDVPGTGTLLAEGFRFSFVA